MVSWFLDKLDETVDLPTQNMIILEGEFPLNSLFNSQLNFN